MPPRFIYGFLCDDARSEQGSGKDIIIGILDRFVIANFAQPLPRFVIFARLGIDDPGPHDFTVELRAPSGDSLQLGPGRMHAREDRSPVHDQFVFRCRLRVDNLMIEEPGRYTFVFLVDNEPIGEIPVVMQPRERSNADSPTEPEPPSSQSPSSSES